MSGIDVEGVLREALDVEWHNGNITEEAAERLPAHVAAVLREQIAAAQAEAWDAGWLCRDVGSSRNPYRAAQLAPSREESS